MNEVIKMRKIVSLAVVAMLLLGLPLSWAQPLGVKKGVGEYTKAKERYLQAMKAYKSARQDYMKFRQRGRVTPERAKHFLLKGTDAMIMRLEILQIKIKHSDIENKDEIIDTLDGYINWLSEKQKEIEEATTREELREIAREIKEKWQSTRVEIKKIAGLLIITKIDKIIDRSEGLEQRLEERISILKKQGYDTAELENLLQDYKEKIELAKQKRDKAKEKFSQISSPEDADRLFREANAFIRDANKYLRESFRVLKQLLREMHKAEVEVYGSGVLIARGNGSVSLHGDGNVVISGTGTVKVKVDNGVIKVNGKGNRTTEENTTVFSGTGRVFVSGRGIEIEMHGNNIVMVARGTGEATLEGKGTYRTLPGEPKEWTGEVKYGGEQGED